MALTRLDHTGDGIRTVYDLAFSLGYLKESDIYVSLDSNEYTTQLAYSFLSATQIVLDTPVDAGVAFNIRRVVDRNNPINDYVEGAILRESNLDASFVQSLMILEELQDGFFTPTNDDLVMLVDIDMNLHRIKNLAHAVDPRDPVTKQVFEDTIADIGNGGGGSGTAILNSIDHLKAQFLPVGAYAETGSYYHGEGIGGGKYVIVANQTVDTYIDHELVNGNVALLLPTGDSYLIEQAGIIADGVYNNYLRFSVILNSEKKFTTNLVDKDIGIDGVDLIDNKSVDLDLNNNTLLSIGNTTERLILLRNLLDAPHVVSAIGFTAGRTTIDLPTGHGIVFGDVVKLYSNQVINPYSEFDQQRCAEYFVVESVTATQLICVGKYIFAHDVDGDTSSRRVARMNKEKTCNLRNIKIRRDLPHIANHYAEAITPIGYVNPKVTNLHCTEYHVALLVVASCFRATLTNITSTWQADVTGDNALGYVGVDRGSQESKWFNLSSGACRHTYTTGANSIDETTYLDTRPDQYGGAVRCHVMSGVAVGTTNFSYDTHQDAWECEFHDIVVYDDSSNTYASSGAFQDRAQNTIVHKLTHTSDGVDVSAGETTVLYNTGARNTYIKEIIKRGKSTTINSFGLAATFTDLQQSFRIDKITLYQEKGAVRIAQLNEPFGLNIGEVHVFPVHAQRTFFSGGGVYFVMSDPDAELRVGEMHLWYDALNQAPATIGSDYLLRLDDDSGHFDINIHTHTKASTYDRFNGQFAGVRALEGTPHNLKSSSIHWTAHVRDWDETLLREATFYQSGEITGGDGTEEEKLKFNYTVLGDNIHRPDSSLNSPRNMFEADMHLDMINRHFGLTTTLGINITAYLEIGVAGNSSTASVATMTEPSHVGQRATITNLDIGNVPYTSVLFKASIPQASLLSDFTLDIGKKIDLVAFESTSGLVWHFQQQ